MAFLPVGIIVAVKVVSMQAEVMEGLGNVAGVVADLAGCEGKPCPLDLRHRPVRIVQQGLDLFQRLFLQ